MLDANTQSNSGFFPFFPYLWKLSGLDAFGICILNALLSLTAMALLAKTFSAQTHEVLLCVSLPSVIFMYVPYSEACFFIFGALTLIGLKRQNNPLIVAGIFFSSLTRPTATLFIPVILLMELLANDLDANGLRTTVKNSVFYSAAAAAGLFLVTLFQWQATGKWFAYYQAQQFWGHRFQLPEIPFTTIRVSKMLWLDGLALWVCLIAIAFSAVILYKRLAEKTKFTDRALAFSAGYLALFFFITVFLNPKGTYYRYAHDIGRGTLLAGLNRYVFASPYFVVLFWNFLRTKIWNKRHYIGAGGVTLLAWLLIGAFSSPWQNFFNALLMTLCIALFLPLNNAAFREKTWPGIYCLNLLLQLITLDAFLTSFWVG